MSDRLCYVQSALNGEIIVLCNDLQKLKFLCSIGARRKHFFSFEWVIQYSSNEDLVNAFRKLRDGGFFFSYDQHGWGPSHLFRYYRDNGLLNGKFKEIYWIGGGEYKVSDE